MLRQIGAVLVIAALAAPALAAEDDSDTVPRRQPGAERAEPLPPIDSNAVPPPAAVMPRESIPVPDRWRIMDTVGLQTHWWDPYNQNTLKADRPLFDDWFFNLGVVSDTVVELRGIPTPVGAQGDAPGSLDVFGRVNQDIFVTSLITSVSFIKGDTAYRPPNYEIRFTPVFNFNRVHVDQLRALRIDPTQGDIRTDGHVALQEAFLDYHIRNVSDRYDFDSVRVGIQPLTLDFRGFLFEDQQLGVRFFGDRDNNKFQYNFGWMRRLEKDTNSGLNDLSKSPRKDDVVFANLFAQDLLVHGYTLEGVVAYNRNREGDDPLFYNKNGFLERPADIGFERPFNYDVVYLGLNGDGHFGRFNLTNVFYAAVGNISANPFTSATRPESASISAFFAAAEPSIDFDWLRVRGSFLFASGDGNPFDNKAHGFDAIFENPQFAGAETSYWIRQPVPLIGGGSLQLSGRDGVLANLRSSKEQGQSNFINPGTLLIGAGVDADVLPELRLSANVNHLSFVKKGVLEVLRNEKLNSRSIGWDTSISAVYRPQFIQNVVFRLSGATLWGGRSFKSLFNATPGNGSKFYSVLFNMILTY